MPASTAPPRLRCYHAVGLTLLNISAVAAMLAQNPSVIFAGNIGSQYLPAETASACDVKGSYAPRVRAPGKRGDGTNVTITQGKTRLEVKCGASNRVTMAEVEYAGKECGHQQKTL